MVSSSGGAVYAPERGEPDCLLLPHPLLPVPGRYPPVRYVLHEETSLDSYANLRTSLLASHLLSNYQKMEKMLKLPPLADSKPLVMLVKMLEYCPAGKSATAVFAYLFLQRLPGEIRVLLSEDDPADVRAIADKADRLIAMHVPQGHDACAPITGSEDSDPGKLVAATQGARRKKFKLPTAQRPQQQQKNQGQRQDAPRRPQSQQGSLRTSMYFYHAKYGKQAKYCEEGCLWPEN